MSLQRALTGSIRLIYTGQLRCRTIKPVETFDPKQANAVPEFAEEVIKLPTVNLVKGKLRDSHRRILMGQKPHDESFAQFHKTVKYKRKLLGQYGIEPSGVSPGIAWPTVKEVEILKEYEKVAYPKTLQKHWQDMKEQDRKAIEYIALREAELERNMLKIEKWKELLHARIQKKKDEIAQAQEKTEKIVAEIRRHFGYNISTQDIRFKTMLQEKEEQERKKRKEDKKKIKIQRKAESFRIMEQLSRDGKMSNELGVNDKECENITNVINTMPNNVGNN